MKRRNRGLSKTPLYRIWIGIIRRCEDPEMTGHEHYGARGIRMCQRWRNDFGAFRQDMGERPRPDLTVNRKDNDRGYSCGKCEDCLARGEPANCEWADDFEQNRNRRTTVWLTAFGKTQSLSDWARELGIGRTTLRFRLDSGWPVERALTAERVDPRKLVEYQGRSQGIAEWAAEKGLTRHQLYQRLDSGWPLEKAMETP